MSHTIENRESQINPRLAAAAFPLIAFLSSMRVRLRFILAISCAAAVLAIAAACGGSSSNKTIDNGGQIAKDTPSVSASAAAKATPTPQPSAVSVYGVPPVLGGNVTAVAPGWAKSVKQSATRTTNKLNPSGVCADVTYVPPATSNLWFRMAVDGQEVTSKLTVIGHDTAQSGQTPVVAKGTICYAPADGLPAGIHSAAVSVQNPQDPSAAIVQTVSWKFEVTP